MAKVMKNEKLTEASDYKAEIQRELVEINDSSFDKMMFTILRSFRKEWKI